MEWLTISGSICAVLALVFGGFFGLINLMLKPLETEIENIKSDVKGLDEKVDSLIRDVHTILGRTSRKGGDKFTET